MKPKVRLGGIVVLVDMPTKNNGVVGDLDTDAILDELAPLFRHIDIEDVNISGVAVITINTNSKDIWKSLKVVKEIALKHYRKR